MSHFLELLRINGDYPFLNEQNEHVFFGGEGNIQALIDLYLKHKGINNHRGNAERFKINCILGSNGSGKSRILSELLQKDYDGNQKWHEYRGFGGHARKYHYLLDDFFKLSPNFKDSINKQIIEDGNFNRFYLNLSRFIKEKNLSSQFISQIFNANLESSDFRIRMKFDFDSMQIDARAYTINDFPSEEADIAWLLEKCSGDKNKLVFILYLYVKYFLIKYHFESNSNEYFNIKERWLKVIKSFEKKYKISKNDALISYLPSEFLDREMDYSDASDEIGDMFEELRGKLNTKQLAINLNTNEIIPESEHEKLLQFIDLFGEIDLIFSNDVSFSNLSAGEKTILIRLINIYTNIVSKIEEEKRKDVYDPVTSTFIIAIDEPDLHLHLEWQKGYIKRLIDILSLLPVKYRTDIYEYDYTVNIHIIIATHSPFIISDLPIDSIIKITNIEGSRVIQTYDGRNHKDFETIEQYNKYFKDERIKNTFGANYIDIINNGFFFEGNILIGGLAEESIKILSKKIKVLRLLDSFEEKDISKITLINELLSEINEDKLDNIGNLKGKIKYLHEKYEPIANLIGDSFLRMNLLYLD